MKLYTKINSDTSEKTACKGGNSYIKVDILVINREIPYYKIITSYNKETGEIVTELYKKKQFTNTEYINVFRDVIYTNVN